MKITTLISCIALLVVPFIQRSNQNYKLPKGASIIETRPLKSEKHSDRALILWMLRPTRNPREASPDEPYTCPEETRGSYYRGSTRVSLVDTKLRSIINTVEIKQEYNEGEDAFDVPYKIRRGSYYHVEDIPEGQEGEPNVMWLRDYNGDGKALEFALFDALACMGLETTLIGYSERQDKVIQYPIKVERADDKKLSTTVVRWIDYLFSKKPTSPGYWKYEIDYRGRSGTLDKYEIRYNKQAERFEGKIVSTTGE